MRERRTITVFCATCGNEFATIPSRIRQGKGKYCSRACMHPKCPEERFWEKVNKDGPIHPRLGTRCWLWMGSTASGYGRFKPRDRSVAAHRYSWELEHGSIDDALQMCHECDNPLCVRPLHLHPGTASQNTQEMWDRKRRDANGELNASAKLTQLQADEILELYGNRGQNGMTLQALATKYNVGTSTIFRIVTGQTWRKEVSIE